MMYIQGLSQSASLAVTELRLSRKQGDARINGTPQKNSRRALITQKCTGNWLYLLAVLCLAFVCEGTAARAQSTFGSILGTVEDPSGAVISGAHVHVTNLNDNSSRDATTNDSGEYLVLNLNPGTYAVTASASNFVDKTLTGMTLAARQQLRADLKLAIGGSQEAVSVEAADASTVNTETGTIGDTKIFEQVV
ncbi:MAG TPA: carboxypeptidase-like regulatory domain-containing protein, partial [Edaphobacter sp.]|nr:carboxypeptidase-like regulatory domain-containing protein [Edaphobacter sp.]